MPITTPPGQPPLPIDDQATFDTKQEDWLMWQYNSAAEFNALEANVEAKEALATDAATTATTKAGEAATSATAALAARDAAEQHKNAAAGSASTAAASVTTALAARDAAEQHKNAASVSATSAAAAWTAALAANPALDPIIRMNPSVVRTDTTIPAAYNAYSAGPLLEIAESTTVTVADTGCWTIL